MGLPLFALEETILVQLENRDGDFYQTTSYRDQVQRDLIPSANYTGLGSGSGFKGNPELQFLPAEYKTDDKTDLLLHFNAPEELYPGREKGNYVLSGGNLPEISSLSRYGSGAALFKGASKGLSLKPLPGSLFDPGTFWSDLSIEFWMFTGNTKEGETVLSWQGYTRVDGKDRPQSFRIYIDNRRLTWEFQNVFMLLGASGTETEALNFSLKNKRSLLAHTWQHHLLRYNASEGIMEYWLDGKLEDLRYMTRSGQQENQLFQAFIGERSPKNLELGNNFNGLLDEFRMSRAKLESANKQNYSTEKAYIMLEPINFHDIGLGSKILNIDGQYRTPGNTGLGFYYRLSDRPSRVSRDDPSWIRFSPGQSITENNQGQYLFLKVEFLSDGYGKDSPGLQNLLIHFQPDPPPAAPGGLRAIPGNGSIRLIWNSVSGTDIRGYLVYYGTRPGEYFGEDALDEAGDNKLVSPIQVEGKTEITLTGLENGRIYYFRVASYDTSNHPMYGLYLDRSYSKEVSARPAP